jgi:diguanylate cyclase (GGDEF)-like protein
MRARRGGGTLGHVGEDPIVTSGIVAVRPSRFRRFVLGWNPLERSVTDRCLLVAWLMLPFSAGYWALGEVALLRPSLAPYYDFNVLASFQHCLAVFVLAWAAILALGAWLRRLPARGERTLVWFTIQLYSFGNAVGAVCAGPVTTPHVIVLVGGVAVGFFLFEPRDVARGMLTAFLVIASSCVGMLAGKMHYAPLLASAPYVDGHVSAFWIAVNGTVAAAAGLALVTLFAYLTARLRDRERRLQDAARTDSLTGVSNRRRFLEVFTSEFERAKRYRSELSCVILDLDHFKGVNDRFGHIVGDRVLVAAADAFRRSLRKPDTIARWGGEEFVLLLPETSLEGAEAVAERCRHTLEEVSIPVDGERVGITVSIGVATYPHPLFESPDALLRSADEALYRAKSSGRNRVVSIPPAG